MKKPSVKNWLLVAVSLIPYLSAIIRAYDLERHLHEDKALRLDYSKRYATIKHLHSEQA